jgi:hypothetical protein
VAGSRSTGLSPANMVVSCFQARPLLPPHKPSRHPITTIPPLLPALPNRHRHRCHPLRPPPPKLPSTIRLVAGPLAPTMAMVGTPGRRANNTYTECAQIRISFPAALAGRCLPPPPPSRTNSLTATQLIGAHLLLPPLPLDANCPAWDQLPDRAPASPYLPSLAPNPRHLSLRIRSRITRRRSRPSLRASAPCSLPHLAAAIRSPSAHSANGGAHKHRIETS